MVTGSHNPPEFNGFKVSVGKSTIFGEEIQKLRKLIEKGEFTTGKGVSFETGDHPALPGVHQEKYRFRKRKLKVVIDAGNGTGGIVAGPLLTGFRMRGRRTILRCGWPFSKSLPRPNHP